MASSSAHPTQEIQKVVTDQPLDSNAPKEHISKTKVDFKPDNYLGSFQLPDEREFLNEAMDWLQTCPLSTAKSFCLQSGLQLKSLMSRTRRVIW